MSFVLGTAGHVDHGKTTLVRELTGIDTDRLPEEKARGISIELGFAWLELDHDRVAFVDVPGHERFVRHMIAGAAGVDALVLVVAADEGVMPQTREHLAIASLLGVSRGLVVLTKVDLVTPEWLALVTEDIAAFLRGTFLDSAPILGFAAGSAELRGRVLDAIASLVRTSRHTPNSPLSRDDRPFFLPFDRVFARPGFGPILTGTTAAGAVAVGDEVIVHPGPTRLRVRALEVHGQRVDRATAGVRLAMNLPGLELDQRVGSVSHPDGPEPTSMIDATFASLPALPRPVGDGERGLVHFGTERVEATLALYGRIDDRNHSAQLRLEHPIVLLPGAPYVFRGFRTWPGRPDLGQTLGGGRALAASSRRRRRCPETDALLAALASTDIDQALVPFIADHLELGVLRGHLARLLPWPRLTIDSAVKRALDADALVELTSGRLVATSRLGPLQRALVGAVGEFHRTAPEEPGIGEHELWTRVRPDAPSELVVATILRLVAAGQLVKLPTTPPKVALPGHEPRSGGDSDLLLHVAGLFERAGLAPPPPGDVSLPNGSNASSAIEALIRAQRLVRVSRDLVFAATALTDLTTRARAYFTTHEWLDAQSLKQLVGGSRKFAIPLGEWLDRTRVTVRVGDRRRLRG